MPYVKVPKDFANVRKKSFLGLTKRQLVAAAAGLVICLPLYYYFEQFIGGSALLLILLTSMPIFFLGFYTVKDGRRPEQAFINFIQVRYRRPRIRPYRAINIYNHIELAHQIQEVIDDATAAEGQKDQASGPLRRFAQARKKKNRKAD